MRLKKLEIYGFKSFAQRTEIVFNQGITGIVGPNGSGKSNIGDAVRWVLGEQSAKMLRGARMEDVIFGGTQKRKSMAYCEVSLVFDNDDRALPMDFAELMVTRRVYRNGESEYYLNKGACRLKDIVDLFRDTGIGREGYSIIGQGRIDEILSQKGEDRRQVFEEAAGIVKFKARKEEAERRLEHTRENLTRVEDILDELQRHIEPLSRQAETARAYLLLSEQLKGLALNIFLIRHDKTKERMTSLSQSLEGFREVLAQNAEQLTQKTLERETIENALAQMEEEISLARSDWMTKNDQWHEKKAELEKYAQRLENGQENEARLRQEAEELERKLLTQESAQTDWEGSLREKEEAVQASLKALEADQTRLQEAQLEAEKREEAFESHKAAILEAMNRLSSVRTAQSRQQAIKAQMQDRLTELLKSEEELAGKEQEALKNQSSAIALSEETKAGFCRLQKEAADLDIAVQTLGGEMAKRQEAMQQGAARRQDLAGRLKLLEEMAREYEGYTQSVRKTLTYAKARGENGVKGVVAMLMQVPKDLETAIDMVLGGALQNIVTQDEPTAKRMIDYLRQNQLGRATFLPMNTIRGRVLTKEERSVLQMPGCLGVASELISFEPQYREIMENLLGRTIVAENLDAGIAIMRAGRQAFRLVTLQGDVMHSGGSITGGSVKAKVTNLLGREREIGEMRQSLTQLEAQLAKERQALEVLENERQEKKRLRGEAMQRVHQEEIAVARDEERIANARAELQDISRRLEKTRDAHQQLTESIQEIEEDLQKISRQTDTESMDQEAMQQKAQTLQGEMHAARQVMENLREEVTSRRLNHSQREHELESLQRDRARLQEEMQKSRAAQKSIRDQLSQAERAFKQDELALEDCRRAELELSQLVESAKTLVDELEKKRAEQQAQLRAVQKDMEALHQESAEQTEKLHRAELNYARVEADLTAMQERIWNEYELTYGGAETFRAEKFDLSAGEKQAQELREQIRAMGTVNVNAIEEYAAAKGRFEELTTQEQDLKKAEEDLHTLIEKLLVQMEQQFVQQFDLLKGYFQETFVRLFGGGMAELKLSDPNDALNCGIEIIAQPPGKKLQLLSLLSGGERALTAIAILFAMLKLKPTPFCILDEIEAALDEANIGYFADYLSEYGKKTQFVVVTHRKGTMERCDALYGVAMEEQGVSKMVSVNLTDYQA